MPQQDDIAEAVGRAQQAMRRRDWLEATRCWEDIRARYPFHAPAYLGAGNALREAGRYNEADLILKTGAERFPDNQSIALGRAWLAHARHDWEDATRQWDAICKRFPNNPWGYLGRLHALRGLGRSDEAEALLAKAETALATARQNGLNSEDALRIEFAMARARSDWPAVRQLAEQIIARDPEPTAQVLLGLAQAFHNLGNSGEADRVASCALAADPALSEAVLIRALIATDRGDGETAVSCYRRMVELNPGTSRWSLKLIQLLTWFGNIKEALSELDNARRRWPNDPLVRMFIRNYGPAAADTSVDAAGKPAEGDLDRAEWEELQAIAAGAPDPAKAARPLIVSDPARDVLVAEIPKAQTAVLVFTGGNDAVSMPLAIFDRYLATLPLTAIYLKDFKRLRYLLGIESLSNDYPGTLAALRDILSGLGAKRLCTIGNCEGGFAAIRYGVEMGADHIVTFGAPTFAPQDSLTRLEQARNFMRNRLAEKVPSEMTDLKPFLQSRQYSAQIEFFYEDEDPRDVIHAQHLSGLPGVRLHPQPGLNHAMLRRMALSNKDFRDVLAKLLGVTPTEISS